MRYVGWNLCSRCQCLFMQTQHRHVHQVAARNLFLLEFWASIQSRQLIIEVHTIMSLQASALTSSRVLYDANVDSGFYYKIRTYDSHLLDFYFCSLCCPLSLSWIVFWMFSNLSAHAGDNSNCLPFVMAQWHWWIDECYAISDMLGMTSSTQRTPHST